MEEKIKLIQNLLPEVMRYNFSKIKEEGRGLTFEMYNYEGDLVFICREGYEPGSFRLYLNINQVTISKLKKSLNSITVYIRSKEREA